jgi:hypothetical protein
LKHRLLDLIGHVSGLSDAQLRQIEKSFPASKALIDVIIRAQPVIEQAQKVYAEAEPLIDGAMKVADRWPRGANFDRCYRASCQQR